MENRGYVPDQDGENSPNLSPSSLPSSMGSTTVSLRTSGNTALFTSASTLPYKIERKIYTQQDLNKGFLYRRQSTILDGERARIYFASHCKCSWEKMKGIFYSLFPFFYWLPRYNVRQDLVADIVAGLTVGVMHIPQGLAYAMLANVPPIYGIYMAFFPVPIYVLLGTSRHISMGSFAVITLMAGKVVIMYQSQMPGKSVPEHMTPNSSASLLEDIRGDPTVQVASVVALTVGAFQILLWALQMGSVAVFLSDILVSGFTTGAAVHVATSQLKHVFGLAVPRHDGPGKILRTYRDLIPMLVKSNVVSLIISGVNIFVLIVNNDYLKPYLAKKCIFPVPIELICVTIGTLLSYTTEMNKNYNVSVVGYLPNGLPAAQVPPVWLMQDMNFLIQCFIIAIVSYAISISLAKLFARRGGYEIAPNQELLAQGAGSAFGSLFGCPPIAASLARSMVQEGVGGRTQLASLVSCSLLVLVLFFIAPYFAPLPKAVLAAIILVALRGLFRQVSDLRRAWQVNKLDAFVWLATFLSAVIIDIDFALGIGFAASVFTLILRNQRPKAYLLGHIPETGIYVDIRRYSLAKEEEGIKILRYEAGLNFANRETFMQLVFQLTHLEPAKWKKIVAKYQKNLAAQRGKKAEKVKKGKKGKKGNAELVMQTNGSSEPSATATMEEKMEPQLPFRNLIFDMTGVTAVDASGVITLTRIFTDYTSIGVNVYFVGATEPQLRTFRKLGFFDTASLDHFFPTMQDAALHCAKTSADYLV